MTHAGQCYHPKGRRTPVGAYGVYHCGRCEQDIYPPGSRRVYHGTTRGYEKHRRWRRKSWPWPACEPCRQAHRDFLNERNQQPGIKQDRLIRSNAQQRALRRLKVRYPADFAKFYAEELSFLGDGGVSALPSLRAELTRLQQGVNVGQLRRDIAMRWATPQEHELWGAITGLQEKIAEVEAGAAAREPDSDS